MTTHRHGFALGIALSVVLAYANGLPTTFGGLDAKESIRDNPYIRNLWPLSDAMSLNLLEDTLAADEGSKGGTLVRRPFLSLTFAINRAILGEQAAAFHVVNIVIHAIAALLLFGLCRRVLARPGVEPHSAARADALAFAIALLWAVHPLQTESVTNLVQRAESLMGLFYLLTLYGVLRATSENPTSARPTALRWGAVAVVACALGMATKETMVTAPIAALLFHWVFTARSVHDVVAAWRLHAALAATWAILGGLVLWTADDAARDFAEGKTLPYILAQPRVILHYLRLALWPDALHVYVNTRAFEFIVGVTPLHRFVLPAAVLALALGAGLYATARRNGFGFMILGFFLVLAPTSSVVATSDVLQEHRIYLSLVCVVAALVIVADRLTRRRRWLAPVLLAGVATALIARTHARNWDYHSEFGMVYPEDMRQALIIVARHEFNQGNLATALDLFDDALAQFPDDNSRAEAHYDLANLFLQRDLRAEAHHHLLAAIRIHPALAAAHNNLGVLLALEGDGDGAEHHLREAIALNPRHYLAMLSLAVVLAASGEEAEARVWLEAVVDALPSAEIARKPLARLEARAADPSLPPLGIDLTLHLMPGYSDAYLQARP